MAAYSTDGRSTGVPSATEDPTGRSDGLRARVVRHRPRRADDMTVADAAALEAFRIRQEQRRAEAYAGFFAPVTAQFLAPLADRLGSPPDSAGIADRGPVLDLGCGTGALARILAGRGWTVVAADRWPAIAALAHSGTGPPVVIADAVRLPVATAALGALAAAFVLPHLPDLPGALG